MTYTLEDHEAVMPDCNDPDCEFHRVPFIPEGVLKVVRNCQLDHKTPTPALWDAKTKMGPWAYLCGPHFKLVAHPTYAGVATKLIRDTKPPFDDPTIEVFQPPEGIPFGTVEYFAAAIEAGYYGCDDDELFSFKKRG